MTSYKEKLEKVHWTDSDGHMEVMEEEIERLRDALELIAAGSGKTDIGPKIARDALNNE